MKKVALLLLLPLLRLCYWLSGYFPRRDDLWIFGSYANSFADNSKYLYTYVHDNHPEIAPVWITTNSKVLQVIRAAGGRAYYRWSPRGIYYALRGKYWFVSAYVSDINYYVSRGACLTNLWHGIPLKKIEFDIHNGPAAKRFNKPSFLERNLFYATLFRKPEWVLSTSDFVTRSALTTAFRVPEKQCISFGYPRLDLFCWDERRRLEWIKRWGTDSLLKLMQKMSNYQNVYIYMPTWRDANPNFIADASLNFKEINEIMRHKNSLLILKLHVATPAESISSLSGLDHIHVMPAHDDIYPILPQSTALISDYSSIYLDYLLLDRPICFFIFDIDKYLAESRGFYYKYEDFSPGHKVRNAKQLNEFIQSNLLDEFCDSREGLRAKLFKHFDGQASFRIVNFIKTLH